MSVKICLCKENATLPTKGSPGAAGYDLYSVEPVSIPPGERRLVSTGLLMKIPYTIYGRIAPRSGLAFHRSIDVAAGVIDSDYRGEIKVLLVNNGKEDAEFDTGTRIAQIVFEKIIHPEFESESEDAFYMKSATDRGDGGFGSTGYIRDISSIG